MLTAGNIHNLEESAAAAGVTYAMIQYHKRKGDLPVPGEWGGRLIYTEEQLAEVKMFFAARKKWQRKPKMEAV